MDWWVYLQGLLWGDQHCPDTPRVVWRHWSTVVEDYPAHPLPSSKRLPIRLWSGSIFSPCYLELPAIVQHAAVQHEVNPVCWLNRTWICSFLRTVYLQHFGDQPLSSAVTSRHFQPCECRHMNTHQSLNVSRLLNGQNYLLRHITATVQAWRCKYIVRLKNCILVEIGILQNQCKTKYSQQFVVATFRLLIASSLSIYYLYTTRTSLIYAVYVLCAIFLRENVPILYRMNKSHHDCFDRTPLFIIHLHNILY